MIFLDQKDMNLFSNLLRVEVDSPLVSFDRVDESQICLSQFGYIRMAFSSNGSPLVEKIFNQVKENKQTSTYFFTPIWQKESDPYKSAVYHVNLTGWKVEEGGIAPSDQHRSILQRIETALREKGLFIQK